MLIDWFTVGAQALNFIVLVWLLKHFLYEPILTAIDAREKRIATELAEADRQKSDAKKERDDFQDKNEKFAGERAALLAQALLEVKAERERLLDDARKAANELLTQQRTVVHDGAVALAVQLKRLAAIEVFEIARKALVDLASADLEERLGAVFTRRLGQLQGEARASLGHVLKAPNASAVVRSRFSLGAKVQATIRNALNETFSADIGVVFDTAPETLCGIELTAGGQRLSWDIAEYLQELEEKVEALLNADASSAGAKPPLKAPPNGAPPIAAVAAPPIAAVAAGSPVRAQHNGPVHAVAS